MTFCLKSLTVCHFQAAVAVLKLMIYRKLFSQWFNQISKTVYVQMWVFFFFRDTKKYEGGKENKNVKVIKIHILFFKSG